jgi:hypothetical protein
MEVAVGSSVSHPDRRAAIEEAAVRPPSAAPKSAPVRHALWLSALAFALHYVWENAQCSLFFVHGPGEATQLAMLRAAAGDVVLTWIAQVAVAAASRRWLWMLHRWRLREWVVLEAVAVVLSVAVEVYALARGRWTYTPLNPRLPGLDVSIVPVLQLALLFPLTFHLVAWRLRRAAEAAERAAFRRRR